jgi:SAM-dependent MidA family methyltransferase
MQQAAWILIDYGYNAAEFFHQQRQQGSLCCFYRHRQHQQWTYLTGLQDISSHVNFSELCFAAENRGLQLSGFTSQAQMILDSGILQQLTLSDDLAERVQLSQQLQQLMMPGAMGELVKVIAFTQGISENAAPRVSSERLTRL